MVKSYYTVQELESLIETIKKMPFKDILFFVTLFNPHEVRNRTVTDAVIEAINFNKACIVIRLTVDGTEKIITVDLEHFA